jgi:phage shock protein A
MLWLAIQLGLVDEAEDPREALDLAHARQVELQAAARRAVLDALTARKRLELRARQIGPTVARLDDRARVALQEGRRDAARDAMTRRVALAAELDELDRQAAVLAREESRLREVAAQAEARVEQLRVRREALRASHAAAAARADVGRLLAEARASDAEARLALEEAERRLVPPPALPAAAPSDEELTRMEEELLWGPEQSPSPLAGEEGRPRPGGGDSTD